MNHFKSFADQSRAKHLGDLMDRQEELEQEDYEESTLRYNKSQVYNFASDFEDIFYGKIMEFNKDVESLIKEYNLYDCDVWENISNNIIGIEDGWSRGDGLEYEQYESSGYLNLSVACKNTQNNGDFASIGVVESDDPKDYGNPDAAMIIIDSFDGKLLCSVLYDVYASNNGAPTSEEDFEEIFIMGEDFLNFVLDDCISRSINDGVEESISKNPPPLG